MNRLIPILVPSVLALGSLCNCASSPTPPPAELQNARVAYSRAQSGPAAVFDQAGLIEARQALDGAEREFDDSPKSDEVKTLSYVAERKAQIAEVDGRSAATSRAKTAILQVERAKMAVVAGQSERKANLALDQLGLAAKTDASGTTITLPGANMFATNEATIRPEAQARLTDVANAVKQVIAENAPQDEGRKMMLIGYTDSTGSDERNAELSKQRAEAVSTFFAQHGLEGIAMETDGRGEADPIGDNETKEGRAQNRRVEIVITRGGAPGGGMNP